MSDTDTNADELTELAASCARGDGQTLLESPFSDRVRALRKQHGETASAAAVRDVARRLLARQRPLVERQPYPRAVLDMLTDEFARIELLLDNAGDEYFDVERHPLRCDLRILTFARVPVGSSQMETGGVPRNYLYCGGPAQGLALARAVLPSFRFAPFFVTHMRHYGITPLNFFMVNSARERDRMYLNVADCLAMHPGCHGYFSASWWLDPALDAFTPHLSHIRRRIVDNGGLLLRGAESPDATADALEGSPARRRLYEAGKYRPRNYAFVWPRDALLRWAERFRAEA